MFNSEVEKVFKDNIHGYISVPKTIVKDFIDTEVFQRLRFIEQTGMRTLYPSARHDRFIHSLGTYYLGRKAAEYLRQNVDRDHKGLVKKEFWDKYIFLFEIACLLHDCGHAPFSHTLEFAYELQDNSSETSPLYEKLKEEVKSESFSNDSIGKGSPHERMSALLVCTEFTNKIVNMLKSNEVKVDKDDDSIEFIVRAIIGAEYIKCDNSDTQIKNCLIQLLNSDSIDVDSLDYIIRDASQAGIESIAIDVERLLSSVTLVERTELINAHLENRYFSTDLNDFDLSDNDGVIFDGRITGEFTIDNAECVEVTGIINSNGRFITFNDVTTYDAGELKATIKMNGTTLERTPVLARNATDASMLILQGSLSDTLRSKIEHAQFEYGSDITLKVTEKCKKIHIISAYVEGTLTGVCSGNFLGKISNGSQDINSVLRYKLGFHKSSLSVIQNVLSARNYEYQWVYSHHKVVYYSNYLIVEALCQCLANNKEQPETILKKILSWKTMVDRRHDGVREELQTNGYKYTFYRPTDYDILYLFRSAFLNGQTGRPPYSILSEFYTRNFKTSLWKSYAEYRIFFSSFTEEEIQRVYKLIKDNSDEGVTHNYGVLKNGDYQRELLEYGMEDVVWVDGKSKLKKLNPEKTFIRFKDCVRTYQSISSKNELTSKSQSLEIFYLYYKKSPGKDVEKDAVKRFFKRIAND